MVGLEFRIENRIYKWMIWGAPFMEPPTCLWALSMFQLPKRQLCRKIPTCSCNTSSTKAWFWDLTRHSRPQRESQICQRSVRKKCREKWCSSSCSMKKLFAFHVLTKLHWKLRLIWAKSYDSQTWGEFGIHPHIYTPSSKVAGGSEIVISCDHY